MKLSFNQKRIGAGILLLAALLCVSNYYFEWGVLGQFDRGVMVGIFIVMFIYLLRVGPTLEEVRDYKDKQNLEKGVLPMRFRPWAYIFTFLIFMLVFVLVGPVLQLVKGRPMQQDDWIELIITEVLVIVAAIVGWNPTKRLLNRQEDRRRS